MIIRRTFACLSSAAVTVLLLLAASPHSSLAGQVVLFDEGHGQRFTSRGAGELDLSNLAGIIRDKGGDVRSIKGKIGPGTLAEVQGLILSGPFQPYDATEVAALKDFLAGGGRLAVMLHVGSPLTAVLESLGIAYSLGVVNEHDGLIDGKSQDFRVTRLEPHPVTEGIEEFSVYGCWAVKNSGPEAWVVASTGPRSWMDLNRSRTYDRGEPVESFGIIVAGAFAEGSFLVFGDDAIFQNRFLVGGNRRLAANLADWLLQ